ncbi:hypothetical protein D3C81_2081870 [compost metagenome]
MDTGLPDSHICDLRTGSRGWSAVRICTPGPTWVPSPMVTGFTSRMMQLKFMKTLLPTRMLQP